ncbi:MAG: ABC transporter substrate-binding protein [Deltaproteobacteria bacterium]|nr:ABC transporter substrate-binding protein [Deltaproteobacteria bacterium]MDZ4345282.1 ABC transporter substrate-binding protein [Candidatus Binatia bacterium]
MKILWGNGYTRAAVLGSVVVLILTLGGDGLSADPARLAPLRLAYSAMTVNQAIPWISVEAGHFKKHGLDVEVVHASSILAMQALLAGEVAVGQSLSDACVSANLSGADTVFIGAILDKPLYSFIVNAKIKTPQDLKGKRVGVTRFGSTPDALARSTLRMWGLDPATDVTLIQLNEMGLLVQGLVNGVIDAAPISLPSNIRAKNLGFTELFDLTKLNKTYITGTVVTRKRFLDGQHDVAKRFMRGFLEGMKTYLENEEFSVKVIQKWTRAKNRDEVKEAYAQQARHMLRVPRTNLEGVKSILEGLDKLPAAKGADPRRFVDSRLLDELEKEGFLKGLYKN